MWVGVVSVWVGVASHWRDMDSDRAASVFKCSRVCEAVVIRFLLAWLVGAETGC